MGARQAGKVMSRFLRASVLCAAALLASAVAATSSPSLPGPVAEIDTLRSRATMQAHVDSIVALGESAIPHLVPRLHSGRLVTELAASAALRELCDTRHVPLLLDECLQASLLGLRTSAPGVIDYIFWSNPGAIRPPVGDDEVDADLSEIVELAVAGGWEGVDLEVAGDRPMLVVGAGLRTDTPMISEGRPVEVVPLEWPDFLETIDDSESLDGRDIVCFRMKLMELRGAGGDSGPWQAEYKCTPTAVAFVSMDRNRVRSGYDRYGFAHVWAKCGGRWRHASRYVDTEVTP